MTYLLRIGQPVSHGSVGLAGTSVAQGQARLRTVASDAASGARGCPLRSAAPPGGQGGGVAFQPGASSGGAAADTGLPVTELR